MAACAAGLEGRGSELQQAMSQAAVRPQQRGQHRRPGRCARVLAASGMPTLHSRPNLGCQAPACKSSARRIGVALLLLLLPVPARQAGVRCVQGRGKQGPHAVQGRGRQADQVPCGRAGRFSRAHVSRRRGTRRPWQRRQRWQRQWRGAGGWRWVNTAAVAAAGRRTHGCGSWSVSCSWRARGWGSGCRSAPVGWGSCSYPP